jgi:two-component system, LytTR family, sensor kinase
MVKVKDKWFRSIAIFCIWLVAVYSNKLYLQPLSWTVAGRALLILTSITLVWHGNRFIILYFRRKLPGHNELPKRIAFTYVTGILFTWLVLICTAYVRNLILYGPVTAFNQLGYAQIFRSLFSFSLFLQFTLFFGIYEALYYYARFSHSEKEKNKLEKEKLWAQLENLNQQVPPHFLFNTLNSLSSLITENPQEADRFLNEMTKVYRYLLDNNKYELVTLQAEIKFINSFYQLLKLRYGKGIELTCQIPPHYDNYQLPPLTLQLLVENAVKHNITSRSQPLQIEITVTGDERLIIKNNLQRKANKPVSHQIGLKNIALKYELMQQGEIIVKEEQGYFIVSLPLFHLAANTGNSGFTDTDRR